MGADSKMRLQDAIMESDAAAIAISRLVHTVCKWDDDCPNRYRHYSCIRRPFSESATV